MEVENDVWMCGMVLESMEAAAKGGKGCWNGWWLRQGEDQGDGDFLICVEGMMMCGQGLEIYIQAFKNPSKSDQGL